MKKFLIEGEKANLKYKILLSNNFKYQFNYKIVYYLVEAEANLKNLVME